ncbi:MAG: 50S ribosomal protein L18 [Nanoarchaeota archaeon]
MRTLKRRRKEYRTDYKKRFALLKSRLPRIVFRKTNKYLIAQYIKSKEAQDTILFGLDSKELLKYGWPEKESIKSIPASYLTGYLMGKKIMLKKLEKPIIDFGMARVIHKTRAPAFIKGLIDSGIKIECEKENFPEESRIRGEHLKNKIPFDEIKLKIDNLKVINKT